MASVDKRNGGWRVRWRDPDGQARCRQCPDRATAEAVRRDVERAVAEGRRWEPRDTRPLPDLREVMEGYVRESARIHRPRTTHRYAETLELFLRWLSARQGGRGRITPDMLSRGLLAEYHQVLSEGGRHGHERGAETVRKHMQVIELMWTWAYENDDEWENLIPRPRRLQLARTPGPLTVAPTWDEMDACIDACQGWHRQLALLLRFTGLRVQQVMGLRWSDVDLERATLSVRGELGKSRQERRGRTVPISAHLVEILRRWERRDESIVECARQAGPREREARGRDMARAWKRAGVRPLACKQPHHAFRKGFISELKRAGADDEAVEFLVGHSLGLRGVYTDPDALPLRSAVELIPCIGCATKTDASA